MPRPAVSVVVTSDYASGKPAGWDDLRASLAALARQDFPEPAEFLLVETAALAPRIPADVLRTLPSLRIVSADARAASALKNAGARAASADIVALIDGDCRAARGWLRHLVSALRDHPEVGVVSGRTTYGDETRFARMMALITRSFLDVGRTAPTAHVTINNAGFRRSTLLAHPRAIGGRLRRLVVGAADRVPLRGTCVHDGSGGDDARRAGSSARAVRVSLSETLLFQPC